MENHSIHQTKILSMNISCCERCPKKLKKKLLKMPGVDSVTIDTARNLVLVTGTIDAMSLVNNVAKLGKAVELLPNEKHPKYKNHFEEKHKDTAHQHKNCCCQDDGLNHNKEIKEEHKCEAYVVPNVDERICRDYYCKIHPKMHKIVDRVPADSSSSLFGGIPFYSSFGRGNPFRDYRYPGWYEEGPRTMLPPHHPFGFR